MPGTRKGAGRCWRMEPQIEYRYWEARLKEGFHFRTVRQIAQSRFEATESAFGKCERNTPRDLQTFRLNPGNPFLNIPTGRLYGQRLF